jgi:hypothetical protein
VLSGASEVAEQVEDEAEEEEEERGILGQTNHHWKKLIVLSSFHSFFLALSLSLSRFWVWGQTMLRRHPELVAQGLTEVLFDGEAPVAATAAVAAVDVVAVAEAIAPEPLAMQPAASLSAPPLSAPPRSQPPIVIQPKQAFVTQPPPAAAAVMVKSSHRGPPGAVVDPDMPDFSDDACLP